MHITCFSSHNLHVEKVKKKSGNVRNFANFVTIFCRGLGQKEFSFITLAEGWYKLERRNSAVCNDSEQIWWFCSWTLPAYPFQIFLSRARIVDNLSISRWIQWEHVLFLPTMSVFVKRRPSAGSFMFDRVLLYLNRIRLFAISTSDWYISDYLISYRLCIRHPGIEKVSFVKSCLQICHRDSSGHATGQIRINLGGGIPGFYEPTNHNLNGWSIYG